VAILPLWCLPERAREPWPFNTFPAFSSKPVCGCCLCVWLHPFSQPSWVSRSGADAPGRFRIGSKTMPANFTTPFRFGAGDVSVSIGDLICQTM
jgi:hypothetical protein